MRNLIKKIKKIGTDNIIFLSPMRPLRNYWFVTLVSSSDESTMVPCVISQDRYRLDESHKITLKPIEQYSGFETRHYYVSDLESMIKDGQIIFLSKIDLDK